MREFNKWFTLKAESTKDQGYRQYRRSSSSILKGSNIARASEHSSRYSVQWKCLPWGWASHGVAGGRFAQTSRLPSACFPIPVQYDLNRTIHLSSPAWSDAQVPNHCRKHHHTLCNAHIGISRSVFYSSSLLGRDLFSFHQAEENAPCPAEAFSNFEIGPSISSIFFEIASVSAW